MKTSILTFSFTILFLQFSLAQIDTIPPTIDNSEADKTNSCWTVKIPMKNIFVDVTIAADNHSQLGNGLTLVADPASHLGGAAVDTRFAGSTTITYTATDSSGNVTKQCIVYKVIDYFELIRVYGFQEESDTVIHSVNENWHSSQRFVDSVDGDISNSILIKGTVNIYNLGDYEINYLIINSRGDRFEKTTIVQVRDIVSPLLFAKSSNVIKVAINEDFDIKDHIVIKDNYYSPSELLDSLVVIFNGVDKTTVGLYVVVMQVTDPSGNKSRTFTLYIDIVKSLGVVKSRDKHFLVYPNPSAGTINVSALTSEPIQSIHIYSSIGKHVYTKQLYSRRATIDLHFLTKGMYVLLLKTTDGMATKTLVLK